MRSSSGRPGRTSGSTPRPAVSDSCATSSATPRPRSSSCPARIEAVEDRLPAARSTLDGLRSYAESAWQPVGGHIEEAEKGLAGARTAVTVGERGDGPQRPSGRRGRHARGARGRDRGSPAAGRDRAWSRATHRRGGAAPADGAGRRRPGPPRHTDRPRGTRASSTQGSRGAIREAERAIDQAHEASREQPADPVRALQLATDAHRIADAVLVAARDAAAAHDRLEAAADSSIRTASTEYDRAATFIASRRRGVGEGARTRLAEARRHLDAAAAVAASDPQAAVEGARRAQQLANDAYRLASSDFSDWDQGGPGWGQRGGTSDGDATADILGQILGGVIGGVIRSGGGGGWGGSPWGGPGRRRRRRLPGPRRTRRWLGTGRRIRDGRVRGRWWRRRRGPWARRPLVTTVARSSPLRWPTRAAVP